MSIVHAIAHCLTCGKEWGAKNAHPVAVRHARLYGHTVLVEVGHAYQYKGNKRVF